MASIIVTDDDAMIRTMLSDALTLVGHTVFLAENGYQCLVHLKRFRPDLVVTDIFMPDKDGIETICEIHDRWPEIKIIAMSNGGSRPEAMDYLSAAEGFGAARILQKPFSVKQALQMVEEVLCAAVS